MIEGGAWRASAKAYRERMITLLHGTIDHPRHHPIYNFLFFYYGYDLNRLLRWSPGPLRELAGVAPKEYVLWKGAGWRSLARGHGLIDPLLISKRARARYTSTASILRQTATRAPQLQCFGLHEWAMLYTPSPDGPPNFSEFQQLPTRLSRAEVNTVVEMATMACRQIHKDKKSHTKSLTQIVSHKSSHTNRLTHNSYMSPFSPRMPEPVVLPIDHCSFVSPISTSSSFDAFRFFEPPPLSLSPCPHSLSLTPPLSLSP